jgi:hypothetical protein
MEVFDKVGRALARIGKTVSMRVWKFILPISMLPVRLVDGDGRRQVGRRSLDILTLPDLSGCSLFVE